MIVNFYEVFALINIQFLLFFRHILVIKSINIETCLSFFIYRLLMHQDLIELEEIWAGISVESGQFFVNLSV